MDSKFIIHAVLVVFILGMSGCSNKQKITEAEGSSEVKSIPCTGYYSDDQYFRASQSGESPELSMAKKQAILNAKTLLASNIQSEIKSVTEQYSNQKSFESKNEKVELEQKIEELTRKVVDQRLRNVEIVCEKVQHQEDQNIYQYFVAIEMPAKKVIEGINDGLTKQQKMQLEYDKKQFQKIYNEEIDKLEKKGENVINE